MRKIKLTKNKVALVDDKNYQWLSEFKWSFDGRYAVRATYRKNVYTKIYMHRLILKVPVGCEVDHINRNKLDNRSSNLRMVTRSQNSFNKPLLKSNTSGYTGIRWHKQAKRWQAYINVNYKQYSLGLFTNILLANRKREGLVKQFQLELLKDNLTAILKELESAG